MPSVLTPQMLISSTSAWVEVGADIGCGNGVWFSIPVVVRWFGPGVCLQLWFSEICRRSLPGCSCSSLWPVSFGSLNKCLNSSIPLQSLESLFFLLVLFCCCALQLKPRQASKFFLLLLVREGSLYQQPAATAKTLLLPPSPIQW